MPSRLIHIILNDAWRLAILELFPQDTALKRWITLARICWLGYGERDKAGLAFNELVRKSTVKAPIVIGRDHLDSGSVASPYRETEAMRHADAGYEEAIECARESGLKLPI